jgi:hypothetical protein
MPPPPPDDRTIEYRGVSGLAIAALVLGLLSPVAFVAPLLWSAPIFAIGFAWAAMHRIKAGGGELAGWNLALLGLLLAVLCGVAAPVHYATRHIWLETRAEAVAGKFVELLCADRPYAAYQLMLAPASRKPLDDAKPPEKWTDDREQKKYESFLGDEPVKLLRGAKKDAIEPAGARWLGSDEDVDSISVRYQVRADNGAPATIHIRLARFAIHATGQEQWRITSITMDAKESQSSG